jgi:hypothetical protein
VLSKAEQNYSTYERELTAIVWACKQFRPYLWGRKFTVITDHQSLIWAHKASDPSSRITRLKLKLAEFEYTIVYKAGKSNNNANGLSRMYLTMGVTDENEHDRVGATEENGESTEVIGGTITLSDKEKEQIISEMHESTIRGHNGMNRTYHRIRQYVTWEGMKNDIQEYIRKCVTCQQNKLTQRNTKIPLTITTTPTGVMEKCSIDMVGPLNPSHNGNRYILTIQDELSKIFGSRAIEATNC